MITLKDFMETVCYRITEGSEYCNPRYGAHAYIFDSWNGIHGEGGHSLSIVFDTVTQMAYEATVCDYTNNQAYRLVNANFVSLINNGTNKMDAWAWEGVSYRDLDTKEDFLSKARTIVKGVDDNTISDKESSNVDVLLAGEHQWIIDVEEDDAGALVLPFPETLMKLQGWLPGDTLEWIDNQDGSWSLKRLN